jgi:hypothetical protein
MRSIYLYKPPQTENYTNTWIYYRVGSVRAEEPAGTLNAPIQICRVSWPIFEDIPPAADTTGITGLETAFEHTCNLLRGQWGVEHKDSVLIGILDSLGWSAGSPILTAKLDT